MAAHRTLVTCPQEQPAKELAFHAEKVVLAGGIFHVYVHSAHGHALPWIRNGPIWAVGVVRSADGGRIAVKDGITSVGLEIEQGIEWGIPSPVGPDVVENAVVVDTIAAANGHFSLAERIPGKTDTRAKIMIVRIPHATNGTDPRSGDTSGIS